MITIEICRQKPTKSKPLSKCEFWARIMGKNGKEIWRTSETYKRRAGLMKAINVSESNKQLVDKTTNFITVPKTGKKK